MRTSWTALAALVTVAATATPAAAESADYAYIGT